MASWYRSMRGQYCIVDHTFSGDKSFALICPLHQVGATFKWKTNCNKLLLYIYIYIYIYHYGQHNRYYDIIMRIINIDAVLQIFLLSLAKENDCCFIQVTEIRLHQHVWTKWHLLWMDSHWRNDQERSQENKTEWHTLCTWLERKLRMQRPLDQA